MLEQITGRVNQIRAEIENFDSDYDREKLQERLAAGLTASQSSRPEPRLRLSSRAQAPHRRCSA